MKNINIHEKLPQIAENKFVNPNKNWKLYLILGYSEGEEEFMEDKFMEEKFKEWWRQVIEVDFFFEKIGYLMVTLTFFAY